MDINSNNVKSSTELLEEIENVGKNSISKSDIISYFLKHWYLIKIKSLKDANSFLKIVDIYVDGKNYLKIDEANDTLPFLLPYTYHLHFEYSSRQFIQFDNSVNYSRQLAYYTASNKEIYQLYIDSQCSKLQNLRRINLKNEVCNFILKKLNNCSVNEYGGGVNSFCMKSSDIDLSVDLELITEQSKGILKLLRSHFQEWVPSSENIISNYLILSKRPLLSLKFENFDFRDDILQVQISVNNKIPQVNTQFVKNMIKFDPRIHQLCFLVKLWATRRGISDSSIGYISNYFWILLTYFFLFKLDNPVTINQFNPPISLKPFLNKNVSDEESLCYWELNDNLHNKLNKNTDTLMVLFEKFFAFYSQSFNRFKNAISFRNQPETGFIDKTSLLKIHSHEFYDPSKLILHFIIEDPFRYGTIHFPQDLSREKEIWYELNRAHNLILKNSSIESIFTIKNKNVNN